MANSYTHLLSPGRIGRLELRNRIVLTSMGPNLAEADGTFGARAKAFHVAQAKGGLGMIIVGVVGVAWPLGSPMPRQLALSEDRFIPALKGVIDAVHEHGAKLAVQLHFAGPVGIAQDTIVGQETWVPSIPKPRPSDLMDGYLDEELANSPFRNMHNVKYKVMTREDIRFIVEKFAAAAVRAREAGADGIELHGGHGYLISAFLSPATNQRTDEYGGSIENRARLLIEIIQAIRAVLGSEFPLWCKLDSQEYEVPEGTSLDDAIATARLAEAAGVNAITVTGYHDVTKGHLHSASHTPDMPERLVDSATRFRAALKVPVIAAGRIELDSADRHLAAGHFDFLAMGRKLLADVDLPRKLAAGHPEDIIPCIYCYTCISQIYMSTTVRCAVNPETAFELEDKLRPAAVKKRVAVVGGGPAGMEAARRLALRGHEVVLLEQSNRLGGTLQFAAIAYAPNERILDWLKRQIAQSKVQVQLKTEATPELLRKLAVDDVVVATGARRSMPAIPGADQDHVLSGDDLRRLVLGEDLDTLKDKAGWATRLAARAGAVTGATSSPEFIREATRKWLPLGERIVIIGGELVGLELAEFLAQRGRKITVIDDIPKFGAGLSIVRRWRVLHELDELGVVRLPGARDIRIGADSISYRNPWDQIRTVGADHVIVAKGASGDLRLADSLQTAGFKVHTAGDCNGVGYIDGAMHSAARVAAAI